ncbi:MAG: leucyl aminopeptidase [Gemmatimonadota bacterium]|nr:MAG: leucyl aminopeptidase [Gemmatimonadota bacterium]
MKSSVRVVPLERVSAPLLAVALGELSSDKVPSSLLSLDANLGGELARMLAAGDFTGKPDEVALMYPSKGAKRVLLVGLAKSEEITRGAVRRSAAIAARKAIEAGAGAMAFHLAPETHGGVTPADFGQVVVEGVEQGAWRFSEFRSDDDAKKRLRELEIIATREHRSDVERGRKIGAAVAVGHRLARNLQALPGNVCTPGYLAAIARELGKAYGFKVTVLGHAQLEKLGMGALLAVAQGSSQEPKFVILEYKGAGRSAPLCFIGKGVTFDSGGISLKPALNMEEMKYDMSGAAAVLGLFEVLGQIKPKANVVGLIPATENLPSGVAIKPGDIVRSHMGKTIEIVNTDAEGRLILCDALSYARRFKPACVIDAATLTGAIVVGLGSHAAGLMGNDDALLDEVRWAGDLAGERCWPLPLWQEYREQIKSTIADVKNTGGRPAGSITAGWFLREFVDGFPWAHIDIAGTAYTDADRPDLPKGPTGIGVRLFTQFVLGRTGG